MTDEPAEPQSPPPWDGLATVAAFPSATLAHEHALVALAMGEACCVVPFEEPKGFALMVEPAAAGRVHHELAAYADEQSRPPPKSLSMGEIFRFSAGWNSIGIWVFCLLMTFYWQNREPSLTGLGSSSAERLFQHGEWWRPFTALFLHADLQHLLGNILCGTLFASLVSRSVHALRGWVLILASGVAGNILTCLTNRGEGVTSIGASTAVFGALGILSGIGLMAVRRSGPHLPLAKTTAPLVAGVVLLSFLGVGQPGDNTDVVAHLMGFGSGFALGIANDLLTHPARKLAEPA